MKDVLKRFCSVQNKNATIFYKILLKTLLVFVLHEEVDAYKSNGGKTKATEREEFGQLRH
jgi:hypothetical protein